MKSNKNGIHVKRNINGSLSRFLGIITKFEPSLSKFYTKVKTTENDYLDKQSMKTLLEAEVKKSQAIELIRKLQNC